jgi:glycine betaine/proline transport system substrate-binding protein
MRSVTSPPLGRYSMKEYWSARPSRLVTAVAAIALSAGLASACGSTVKSAKPTGKASCQQLRLANEPWSGSTANAYVVGYVAKTKLGCNVSYADVKEQVGWAGIGSGEIDANLENWGHEDLAKKYITDLKTVVDAGPTGGKGIIGWYVPPWMAKAHPDITSWKNLDKYASLFKTSESEGKGQLLDGDPSYVTNDEALAKNLHLDYKVVTSGSEAGLIQSFKSAEKNHTPLLAYFYQPHWLFSQIPLVHVSLPPYTAGCDADPAKVACDYPPHTLNKQISAKFAKSASPAVGLIKSFHWSNDDQNQVTADMAHGMSPEAAAKKWVDAHPEQVSSWLHE